MLPRGFRLFRRICGALLAAALLSACFGGKAPPPPPPAGTTGAIGAAELTGMLEAFADTYVQTISQAVDAIQAEHPSPKVRAASQKHRVYTGMTAFEMAITPNPAVGLLDTVVNISIQRATWTGPVGKRLYGDASRHFAVAYATLEPRAWSLAARVLTPEQMTALHQGIDHWLQEHPDRTGAMIVKFDALDGYREVSPLAPVTSGGLVGSVREATRVADEMRLLGMRSLFLAQRMPMLITWQSELVMYDGLAEPETRQLLGDAQVFVTAANKLARVAEQLPDPALLESSLGELRGILEESAPLAATARDSLAKLNEVLGTTDRVLTPFQTPGVGGGPPTFETGRYVELSRELATTFREVNALVTNMNVMTSSPDTATRLRQVDDIMAGTVQKVSAQGNVWMDRFFRRLVLFGGAAFAGLIAYRWISLWLEYRFFRRQIG